MRLTLLDVFASIDDGIRIIVPDCPTGIFITERFMEKQPMRKAYSIPKFPKKDIWDYPGAANRDIAANPAVGTPVWWKDKSQAFFYAGNTLFLWNEATELKPAFLAACSVEKGQNVLVIGKYLDESGLLPALKSLAGPGNNLKTVEIGQRAVDALRNAASASGKKLQWGFDYLDSVPENSLDRIILFSSASHVANWEHFAAQIDRTLRAGGKLIIGETPLGGKEFRYATHLDAHDEGYILRILESIGIAEDELPDTGTDELGEIFKPYLGWSRAFNWDGLYLFYGQKGGQENDSPAKLPPSTPEVMAFLTPKNSENSWDFLAAPEKAVWSEAVASIIRQDPPRSGVWGSGVVIWGWLNHPNVTDVMYRNLMAEPSDKVMLISEGMVYNLGVVDELKKRIGEKGQIEYVIMSPGGYDYDGWQKKRADYMARGCGEEWPYDFADRFPDNYFDLIILPQGVHHSNDWVRDAPRLLRALKPGRQIMFCECGVNCPEHFATRDASALARLVIDRMWDWLPNANENNYYLGTRKQVKPPPQAEHKNRPYHVVIPEDLMKAFGGLLEDPYGLEQSGFILFFGYKK